jgi:hypothetical protein
MQIHDDRFLRALARRFIGRAHALDHTTLDVVDFNSDALGLEIRIFSALSLVIAIAWARNRAWLLPHSTMLTSDDLFGLDEAFTDHVARFLRKHHFIDENGRATRRSIA